MASRSFATTVGFRSSAQPSSTNSRSYVTVVAFVSAASSPPWSGASSQRKQVPWLPRPDVPITNGSGVMTPAWYRFFSEVAENRLAGVAGPKLTEVLATSSAVQEQIVGVQTLATGALTVANASADAINTTASVAQGAGLPGADDIPPVDRYEAKYGRNEIP